jgi:TPR repeat protein
MALDYLLRRSRDVDPLERRIEPRLEPASAPATPASEVFDTGRKTIVDRAHVRVERLDTHPVLYSKVFKEFEDPKGQKYDYRYWSERENFFLREFLKKQNEFTHVVQARHLISENEAAKQVLTCDAGVTVANWLRVRTRYADTATLSNPFQRSDAFLHLLRASLVALKQIHQHRIVHCDIKEDNICIPYAPYPLQGGRRRMRLEFGQLKLIDFAFSIAHAMPLTQILVIDPEERLLYQSERLIAALQADRRSGSPNAVQQLDYGVDLFSLGHIAEKISTAGLECPPGADAARTIDDIGRLVKSLKAFDSAPAAGPLPHDGLIAEIDRLLAATSGACAAADFLVDGEWSAQEMARSDGAVRHTPATPVALPLPTAISLPFGPVSPRPRQPIARKSTLLGLVFGLVAAAGAAYLYRDLRDATPLAVDANAGKPEAQAQPTPGKAAADPGKRLAALLRSDDEREFQSASSELAQMLASSRPSAVAIAGPVAAEYGEVLGSSGTLAARLRAMNRLAWMARAGEPTAEQRVAAFEKSYDEVKHAVARTAWWSRGEGPRPEGAARWMEDGELLAKIGDRPAMLDLAFALAHGRGEKQDRLASVATYLKVLERSSGGDPASSRIRQAAVRGLASLLNTIVEQKDQDAARRVLPAIEARADAGAADLQYFSGLLSECVLQPADFAAARQWYRRAAADPGWRRIAAQKERTLGRWCPAPAYSG